MTKSCILEDSQAMRTDQSLNAIASSHHLKSEALKLSSPSIGVAGLLMLLLPMLVAMVYFFSSLNSTQSDAVSGNDGLLNQSLTVGFFVYSWCVFFSLYLYRRINRRIDLVLKLNEFDKGN